MVKEAVTAVKSKGYYIAFKNKSEQSKEEINGMKSMLEGVLEVGINQNVYDKPKVNRKSLQEK